MKVSLLPGLRFQAPQTLEAISSLGADIRVFTTSPATYWDLQKCSHSFVPMPFKILQRLLRTKRGARQKYLDAWVYSNSVAMKIGESDIVHGWASFSLETFNKCAGSAYLILERACPHILEQVEIMETEGSRLGADVRFYEPMIDRMLKEYELADLIITPSQYTKRSFIKHGISSEKILCAPLKGNFTAPMNRTKLRKSGKIFTVGTVGGNSVRKGFSYLVDAWQSLSMQDAKLLIKTSSIELKRTLPGLYRRILADKTIEIVDYVKDINVFYDALDAFCLCSVDEGFGMVVAEALSHGLPVLVTENVGAGDILIDIGEGKIVPIRDPEEIKKWIFGLYDNKTYLYHDREKITSKLKTYYNNSSKCYSKSIIDLYSSVVDNR